MKFGKLSQVLIWLPVGGLPVYLAASMYQMVEVFARFPMAAGSEPSPADAEAFAMAVGRAVVYWTVLPSLLVCAIFLVGILVHTVSWRRADPSQRDDRSPMVRHIVASALMFFYSVPGLLVAIAGVLLSVWAYRESRTQTQAPSSPPSKPPSIPDSTGPTPSGGTRP